MDRNRRGPRAVQSLASATVGGAVLVAALTGCSATNPNTTALPYTAADGSNGAITNPATGETVKLLNFLLVGSGKGKPAVLIGAIANEGTQRVKISLSLLENGTPTQIGSPDGVIAEPGVLTKIGPGGTDLEVAQLPAGPGVVVTLRVDTGAGGSQLNIPVVATAGYYASITPAAAITPEATTTPDAATTPDATPSQPSPS